MAKKDVSENAGEPKFVTEHPEEFHKFRGSMATGKPMCARLLPEEKMCILEIGHDDDAHEGEILPWATRIPAAIKRAEELTQNDVMVMCRIESVYEYLTATEAALAEALWDLWTLAYGDADEFDDPWKAALIAFTEKVEVLDG